MSQPLIQIDSLSHSYGDRRALADVSLAIQPGEIFGFLGPNGSGKTTLFRILSTLIAPQSGTVHIHFPSRADDSEAADLALNAPEHRIEFRRHIGVVFQSPSLDRELTAEENLRHHGHLYGLRGEELSCRIDDMLHRFDLADRRHEYVKTFSGGMRRRVELAKGLLTRPSILLMDEPATGLDPTARIDMWRSLQEVRAKDGVTILVTTHLMDEAERCDRLAILHRGQVVACGSPAELKEQIGGEVITLTSHDVPSLKQALVQKLAIQPEEMDAVLRIERPRAHEFVPQLVEAAPGLVESVSVGKPTLEDVFIRATGHRFKDEMV